MPDGQWQGRCKQDDMGGGKKPIHTDMVTPKSNILQKSAAISVLIVRSKRCVFGTGIRPTVRFVAKNFTEGRGKAKQNRVE